MGELGRDRRRVGAAGAVGVTRLDALTREDPHALGCDEDVRRRPLIEMSALDEHRPGARLDQQAPRGLRLGQRAHLSPRERLRLVHVRRDERRQREEELAERRDRVGTEKGEARLRDHHGIEDVVPWPMVPQRLGDRLDHRGGGQHPRLDRADLEVAEDGVHLGPDQVEVDLGRGGHAPGVLGGDGGDRGRAVAAVRGDGLQVGLDARARRGVRARNGQDNRDHVRSLRRHYPGQVQRVCSQARPHGPNHPGETIR